MYVSAHHRYDKTSRFFYVATLHFYVTFSVSCDNAVLKVVLRLGTKTWLGLNIMFWFTIDLSPPKKLFRRLLKISAVFGHKHGWKNTSLYTCNLNAHETNLMYLWFAETDNANILFG